MDFVSCSSVECVLFKIFLFIYFFLHPSHSPLTLPTQSLSPIPPNPTSQTPPLHFRKFYGGIFSYLMHTNHSSRESNLDAFAICFSLISPSYCSRKGYEPYVERGEESRQPFLIPYFNVIASNISPSRIMLAVGLPYIAFICWAVFSLNTFIMMTCWKCQKHFCIYWADHVNLIYMIYYIYWLYVRIYNYIYAHIYIVIYTHIYHPCICGVKPVECGGYSFCYISLFGLQLFYWEFMHLYSLGILSCNFIFCCYIFT